MTKGHLLLLSLLTLALSSGCAFWKKSPRTKESSTIAADVEESFRRRWVDQRVGQLTAQGVAAATAKTQAETEFRERYGFTRAGQK